METALVQQGILMLYQGLQEEPLHSARRRQEGAPPGLQKTAKALLERNGELPRASQARLEEAERKAEELRALLEEAERKATREAGATYTWSKTTTGQS